MDNIAVNGCQVEDSVLTATLYLTPLERCVKNGNQGSELHTSWRQSRLFARVDESGLPPRRCSAVGILQSPLRYFDG